MNNTNDILIRFNDADYSYKILDSSLFRIDTKGKGQLIQCDVLQFDLAVDSMGVNHLIIVLKNGVFNYMREEQGCWIVKNLEKYPDEVNKIENINIECKNDMIHIIYDFRIYGKNAKNYNYKSFILHVFKKGNMWRKSTISTFTQSKPPKYFYEILSNGDLCYFKAFTKTKYTSLTPLRFSARKMTWTQKKELKLFQNIGKLVSITSDEDLFYFFFYNKITEKLNFFNILTDFTEKSKTFMIYNREEIDITTSIVENDKIKLLASYPDSDEEVLILENEIGSDFWDTYVYDLKIKKLKYVNELVAIPTLLGSDENQTLVMLIDEFEEFPQEEESEEIEEVISEFKEEKSDNKAEDFEEEIEEIDVETEEIVKENIQSPAVIEEQLEASPQPDPVRSDKIKLQIDNILKRITTYLLQND